MVGWAQLLIWCNHKSKLSKYGNLLLEILFLHVRDEIETLIYLPLRATEISSVSLKHQIWLLITSANVNIIFMHNLSKSVISFLAI